MNNIDFQNGFAVGYSIRNGNAKTTAKTITEPCHIADLEPGTYIVKNDFVGEYSGKVTIANIKDDGETVDDDYFTLNCGLLVVFENFKQNEEDGTITSVVGFTAQGLITVPNQSYTGDFLTLQQTIKNTTSIQGYLLISHYMSESEDNTESMKWFSEMPEIVMCDIPATAMISEITEESTHYDFPNAVAVRRYVNQAMLELFDGEDYTDAYAVLSKNPPNMLKHIGNMIGVIEN